MKLPSIPLPTSNATSSGSGYKNILFRLKHLGRPVATWMETFSPKKTPVIGDRHAIPSHLPTLEGISAQTSIGVVSEIVPDRELLVVYMTVERLARR